VRVSWAAALLGLAFLAEVSAAPLAAVYFVVLWLRRRRAAVC